MLEYLVNRIQFGMEKELLKDIFGVILLIRKLKNMYSKLENRFFFHNAISIFKKKYY